MVVTGIKKPLGEGDRLATNMGDAYIQEDVRKKNITVCKYLKQIF